MEKNIIKLGGSIITDNTSKANFNRKNTLKIAEELLPCHKGSIIIHGTGQVGKPPAIKHGYVDSGLIDSNNQLLALNIKSLIRQLNHHVILTLLSVSIPAIPVDILHFFNKTNKESDSEQFKTLLNQIMNNGIVPVFNGDLLPQEDGSFKVISSDWITLVLAELLNPDNVFFLTDVNGVYSEKLNEKYSSDVIPVLTPGNVGNIRKLQTDKTDVSGGMQRKVKIALETAAYCKRCFIGNGLSENILSNLFNENKVIGTYVSIK